MLEIHNFFVELFPVFQQQGFDFVYIFFDIASIIFLVDLFLYIPKLLLFRGKDL